MRVLIVEDKVKMAGLLRRALRADGQWAPVLMLTARGQMHANASRDLVANARRHLMPRSS